MRIMVAARWTAVGLIVLAAGVWAQQRAPERPVNASADPLLKAFEFRSIGPAIMMGRVDDIAGSEKDPMILYAAFATGGLWRSTDGGLHWKSMFDEMPNESVGAVAIAPSDPNVVYAGMGEANNRQSSSIGDGIRGTTDGGVTWKHLGLEDTQSIARIVVDPANPRIVYVAAMGHLFGPNTERGLYKSVDGGVTWKKSKYIDPDTGFTDVAIDPTNPKILYAASLMRRRTWMGYNGGGPNSALWKTTDAGDTWTKLDGPGWPKAPDGITGRIAISVFRAKPTTLYAQVEVGASAGAGGGTTAEGGPARGGRGGGAAEGQGGGRGAAPPPDPNKSGVFRSDDSGGTWQFMSNQNQRPTYFSQIRVDPANDQKLMVGGNPGQMSLDGGKTWKPMTASHTDYHAMWINPKDPRNVFIGHDGGIDSSNDGGFTWDYHNDIAVGQFYQVSADNRRPYYVCGGLQDNNAWCGPSALRNSSGPVNTDWFTVSGGDGMYTRQDPTDWAIVYSESQDANINRQDFRNGTQKNIRPNAGPGRAGNPPVDPNAPPPGGGGGGGRGGPPNIVNVPANAELFRFYWDAPFEISPFNPATVYMAAQYFLKSVTRGDSWTMSATDLTKKVDRWSPETPIMNVAGDKPMAAKHDGYSSSSLATQVRESPSRPGVIWIGTDDGNVQVSQDGGETFTNVAPNIRGLPPGYVQVTRIEPSHLDPAPAYVSFDNHRNDDWKPYLFKTADFGKTWTSVAGNLPVKGNINALREDYDNSSLLFVGTEFGLYVTLDGGREWKKFMTGLPSVRVDDILIHPRDRDLIVATHGRSIWICDDITPLEHLKVTTSDLALFDPRPAVLWKNDPQAMRRFTNRQFAGQNPQGGTAISVWSKNAVGAGKVEFLLNNNVVSTMDVDIPAGLSRYQWNMRGPAPPAPAGGRGGQNQTPNPDAPPPPRGVPFIAQRGPQGFGFGQQAPLGPLMEPGIYMVRVTAGAQTLTSSVNVLEDIWMRPQ